MKIVLITSAICLFAISAHASNVILKPGASAVINPGDSTAVTCEGVTSNLPDCAVGVPNYSDDPCRYGVDNVQVKVGSQVMVCVNTVEAAIVTIKKYRVGGICK